MVRYKSIASDIAALIETGELRPGQGLPSLREASVQRSASVSTMLKAYHLLEARGLIQARARSGFHVSAQAIGYPPAPAPQRPATDLVRLDKGRLIEQILHELKHERVIPLGSAFPDPELFPLRRLQQSLARSMRRLEPARSVKDITPGNPELLRLIALRHHLHGIELQPGELTITHGAIEALNLCLQAVTRPGDTVIIESPAFYICLQTLERLGLRAVEVSTDPVDGVDLQALERLVEQHRPAALWLMSSFQNPLGSLMPDARKRDLAALLSRWQLPLVEDDVYAELYFGNRRPPPVKAFDREGWVMSCSSFSKSLAPGYRIGWAAAGRFTQTVQSLQLSTSLSAALPSQLALADYLDTGAFDIHLRALRRELERRRDALVDGLQRHLPVECRLTRPQGGYFLWLELPAGHDSLDLFKSALDRGVSIAPGCLFTARHDLSRGLRLNYGHPGMEDADKGIRVLARLIGDKKGSGV